MELFVRCKMFFDEKDRTKTTIDPEEVLENQEEVLVVVEDDGTIRPVDQATTERSLILVDPKGEYSNKNGRR